MSEQTKMSTERRAAITTAIVIAMLLGAAMYQALELERLR